MKRGLKLRQIGAGLSMITGKFALAVGAAVVCGWLSHVFLTGALGLGRTGEFLPAGLISLLVSALSGAILWHRSTDGPERDAQPQSSSEDERSFEALANMAPAGIFRTDASGNCIYVNTAWKRLSGLDDGQWEGDKWRQGIHPEDIEKVYSIWIQAVKDLHRAERELRWLRPDGTSIWTHVTFGPEFDDKGNVTGFIGVATDIEKTKQLESELIAAKEEAEAATEARSDFLATISHEIRTPMNGVIGLTEVALAGELEDETRTNLEMLAESGRAMLDLLNDLLDSAKMDAGRMEILVETINIEEQLSRALAMMSPVAAQKHLSLTLDVDDTMPRWIAGDATRLGQIVLNLVGNALKFTDSGTVSIGVKPAPDGSTYSVSVADTGIGIAEDKLEKIFKKFAQADASIDRRFGGTGLGLAICAQLAELLGGKISVESTSGKGSTFTVTLPLERVQAPAVNQSRSSSGRSAKINASSARILVADDNVINQRVTRAMLARLGLSATFVSDGQAALSNATEAWENGEPYDLILMDVWMPEMDGLTASRAIRDAGIDARSTPIIAVSAAANEADYDASLAAGMQAHLAKPLALAALAEMLERWLGRSKVAVAPKPKRQPSAKLRKGFAQRKADALTTIEAAATSDQLAEPWLDQLAAQLHQIAGVAAYFGETELGQSCGELDQRLRTKPETVAHADLNKIRELLRA